MAGDLRSVPVVGSEIDAGGDVDAFPLVQALYLYERLSVAVEAVLAVVHKAVADKSFHVVIVLVNYQYAKVLKKWDKRKKSSSKNLFSHITNKNTLHNSDIYYLCTQQHKIKV